MRHKKREKKRKKNRETNESEQKTTRLGICEEVVKNYTLADDANRDSPPAMVTRLWNSLRLRPFRGLLLEVLAVLGLSGSRGSVTFSDSCTCTLLGVSSPAANAVAVASSKLPPSFSGRAGSSPWSMLLFLGFSGCAGTCRSTHSRPIAPSPFLLKILAALMNSPRIVNKLIMIKYYINRMSVTY